VDAIAESMEVLSTSVVELMWWSTLSNIFAA
jgi:hypothetical protein